MKLNNIEIVAPRELNFDYIEISRERRTASGRSVKDIIAIKRIFVLPYKGLKPETMQVFINTYVTGLPVPFEYEDNNGIEVATVRVKSLPRMIPKSHPQYSQNVTITLEEV